MKRTIWIRVTAMLVCGVCMIAMLSSCSFLTGENTATELVQGNLDEVYLGKIDQDYLDMVDSTEEEAQAVYLEGLTYEAEYFAYYWGIIVEGESLSQLDESLQQAMIDLYRDIYSHASYKVHPATLQSDESYVVKVEVDPIDIMVQADEMYNDMSYEPLTQWMAKSQLYDWERMTDEEYWAATNEFGWIIVEMVESLLPSLGYEEQKSIAIQVQDVDGYLQINEDDFAIFDSYVITYP